MEVSALTHPSTMPGLRGPSALLRLQSDERLIALTRRGQPAAFETLCTRYQSRLLSFCRHMLNSREDAEDVLQEVFAAAFNAVLADEREINVRPWLYRIARNRSLNHLRRTAAIGVDSMDVHFAENGISTGDKVLRRESFRELIADVHELPETQRTALLLREIDALSYEQISQAMETTVPSVKSLLVRARISLAEAAEARKLSCEEVRLELGEAAEGLTKLSTSARRHVRGCDRCLSFKKHLRENNRALAAILPVAPLLLLKKVLLAKIGSTASAGGAHAAGAGATVGATVGAGAAAGGGTSLAGGLMTAGAGALATKAVAGLAAAAIVTAGAVAADHAVVVHHHHHPLATASASVVPIDHYSTAPVVVREQAQPISAGVYPRAHRISVGATATRHHRHALKVKASTQLPPATKAATTVATAIPVASTPAAAPAAKPVEPQNATQVTEVTSETTQLPTTTTTTTTTTPAPPTTTTPPGTTPTGTAPEESVTPAPPTPSAPSAPGSTPEVSTPEPGAVAGVASASSAGSNAKTIVTPSRQKTETGGTEAPAPDVVGTDASVHHPTVGWGARRSSRR
jgi:RNA polymerase sigma factor (sigma-70 family)